MRDVLSRIIIVTIAFLYEDAVAREKKARRWIAPVIAKLRHGTESRRLSREGERKREEERISRKHVFVFPIMWPVHPLVASAILTDCC